MRRKEEATQEVDRILSLEKGSFSFLPSWGFEVLGVTERDIQSVRHCYRALMKKLHPDKTEQSPLLVRAVEKIHEAKIMCENSLSPQSPPGVPRCFLAHVTCSVPGRRRYRVQWSAPEPREGAPVLRYLVAIHDPWLGKVVRLATLEPDYSQELGRFLSVEEMGVYELAEEDLGHTMPGLFQQAYIRFYVAAANTAGQSIWCTSQIPIQQESPRPGAASPVVVRFRSCS